MSEAHVDNPGEIRWFKGYGPAEVLGSCPHDCPHNAQTTIAWGPSLERYELVACDKACGGFCRAWIDDRGRTVTAWLETAAPLLVPA